MRIGFVLFKYFPFGGLQRDMVRIAGECKRLGQQIHVFTLSWEGEVPAGFDVHSVDIRRLSNFRRYQEFSNRLPRLCQRYSIDGVVGFNKLPGLDVYYAADPCFREKWLTQKNWLTRRGARNRFFLDSERAVFDPAAATQVLMISPQQLEIFVRHYQTPRGRLHLLPPGISRDRMAPPDAELQREAFRREHGLGPDDRLVLAVGSGFRVKGLDRSLKALAALPALLRSRTRLIAIGQDNPKAFLRLADSLGVGDRFSVLAGRDDIPRFLLGADLLLHPAYYENTGTVLLEAVIAGLPVLTTDTCGYAFHVTRSGAGRVVPSPFDQRLLELDLEEMLCSADRAQWSRSGIAYGREQDLYRMPELAAGLIVDTLERRKS